MVTFTSDCWGNYLIKAIFFLPGIEEVKTLRRVVATLFSLSDLVIISMISYIILKTSWELDRKSPVDLPHGSRDRGMRITKLRKDRITSVVQCSYWIFLNFKDVYFRIAIRVSWQFIHRKWSIGNEWPNVGSFIKVSLSFIYTSRSKLKVLVQGTFTM